MNGWSEVDQGSTAFREIMETLVAEWGTFLDARLYTDAVVHFRGGDESVVQAIDLAYQSRPLGRQRIHLLNPTTAFKITTFPEPIEANEKSLRQFLSLTSLRQLQWVNFRRHTVAFRTISND